MEDDLPQELGEQSLPHRKDLWPVYRTRRGVYRYAAPGAPYEGEFRVFTTSEGAALNACREFTRNDFRLELSRDSKRRQIPVGLYRRGTEHQFPCGHLRIPENTYQTAKRKICRTCSKKHALAYYREHRLRIRAQKAVLWKVRAEKRLLPLTEEERSQDQGARLMYGQLRQMMLKEGLWERRVPFTEEES